jgi:hypothetical protein
MSDLMKKLEEWEASNRFGVIEYQTEKERSQKIYGVLCRVLSEHEVLIKALRKSVEALERLDSKDRNEEKSYLAQRIEVRQAVVEAYRLEARQALKEINKIMGA